MFGRAKDFGLISINGLSNALGNERSDTLIVIHAFTCCDMVLSLLERKKTNYVGDIGCIYRCDIKNDD